MGQDLRYGFRMLLKQPAFTIIAVVTLALGIGANTAIYSVVDAVLLRPLAFKDPDRLMVIYETSAKLNRPRMSVSPADLADWKQQSRAFEDMTGMQSMRFRFTGGENAEFIAGRQTSASFFPLLGVKAAVGRVLLAEDEQPESERVAVLSDSLWRRNFGADASVVGKSITLDEQSYTVVGILPASFLDTFDQIPGGTQVWVPMKLDASGTDMRGSRFLRVIARLKSGVTLRQANAEIEAITARLAEAYPASNDGIGVFVSPMHDEVSKYGRQTLLLLMAAVGFVLLIACANVANLTLTRTVERRKEIAIRAALGAGRMQVARQSLTESVLLAFLGGSGGLLLARWGVDVLKPLLPSSMQGVEGISVNGHVLGFTLVVSLLTGILIGLVPALQASKVDLIATLKDSDSHSRAVRHVRHLLVVAQIALALVLLSGAGLMLNSVIRLALINTGLELKNMLVVEISRPRPSNRDTRQYAIFFRQLLEQAKGLPGVQAAAVSDTIPLSGLSRSTSFKIPDRSVTRAKPISNYAAGSEQYFGVMGIHLIKGRALTNRDTADAPPVIVVNESLARLCWSGEDPTGKTLLLSSRTSGEQAWTVVGIVQDVRGAVLQEEPKPQFYRSYLRDPSDAMSLLLQTPRALPGTASAVRSVVRALDPNQPITRIATME